MPATEPTEPMRQTNLDSSEDAISPFSLDLADQYKDLYPEEPFWQPIPEKEHSEQPSLSPLEDAIAHLKLNRGSPYGELYLEVALLHALKEARLDVVEELLQTTTDANLRGGNERASLSYATELGFQQIVAGILRQGASMDKQDEEGQTLLCRASLGGNIRIMSLLLDNGADVELADDQGWTPLMVAAERGHHEAVALLLKHGADPNARDNEDFTPLLHAAMIGYRDIVERLLDAGADPNAQDETQHWTAMSWAAESGHDSVVKLLLERGVDPNVDDRVILCALSVCGPDEFEDSDRLLEILIKHGADVFMDQWSDERPLVIAARQGRCRTVDMFLEASYSSRSVRQDHIWDAITLAAEEEREEILESLMKHYEMDDAEKRSKWKWVQESQLGDSLELLRPYFGPVMSGDEGSN